MTALSPTNTWNYYNPFYVVFALVNGDGCAYGRAIKSYATEREALDHKEAAETYLIDLEDEYFRGDIDLLKLEAKLRADPWDSEAICNGTQRIDYFVLEVFQP